MYISHLNFRFTKNICLHKYPRISRFEYPTQLLFKSKLSKFIHIKTVFNINGELVIPRTKTKHFPSSVFLRKEKVTLHTERNKYNYISQNLLFAKHDQDE